MVIDSQWQSWKGEACSSWQYEIYNGICMYGTSYPSMAHGAVILWKYLSVQTTTACIQSNP
jgi:hypothetical protein